MLFNGTLGGELPGFLPARIISVDDGLIEGTKPIVLVAMSTTLYPELLPLEVAVSQLSCGKHPQATSVGVIWIVVEKDFASY